MVAAARAAARAAVGATAVAAAAAVAASNCRSGQVRVLGNHFLSFSHPNGRNWGGARNLASISFFNVVSCPPAPAGVRKLERGGAMTV